MSENETAARLAVHEAVCAERWKQASDRLARIEIVLAAIVLLLLIGEGSLLAVVKRLVGG
jgi:hypothetical protein